jgi:DNA-binding response OmpR family regulator
MTSVAMMNGDADIVEVVQAILTMEGFTVSTILLPSIKRGHSDLIRFMKEHDPEVVIYDISPPYDEAVTFFHLLMSTEAMKGRQVVLTTTNKSVLQQTHPEIQAHELIGKPYDMDELVKLVRAHVLPSRNVG